MRIFGSKAELLNELDQGIVSLVSTDKWQDYLRAMGKFRQYSPTNINLIMAQKPGASRVAGYKTWLEFERNVKKGESAIWILAPIFKKSLQAKENLYGAFEGQSNEDCLIGFRSVPVFDISQTEGKELPEVCRRLEQEGFEHDLQLFKEAASSIGFYVEETSIGDGSNGDCTHALRRIRIEESNSSAQKCKTMAHELTHAILHENFHDRALAELEAESTAFLICSEIGIDSSSYTFGYLATWAGGHENASILIKNSANRIRDAATKILEIMNLGSRDMLNESLSGCREVCLKAA